MGVARGDCSSQAARLLWNSLPGVYRQCAVSYTDFWSAYSSIFPKFRHRALGLQCFPYHLMVIIHIALLLL